ncbi:MAG: histidinol dehydrogenase [Pseudomonadales bacterium]|jgi:histidinol dehydrogenase|nr:histidinol dehydrogenase [Pseudomonadales bacterium]MDP7144982.1 histidinol dehydrogenase [Pseudomonadales bacterium]MDP7357164.1 histidinol dehydrogenase [Pseudomonadales bacterium]MDP7594773.1 histidinol dehydrogenase [Pseudomonadales bacterium]HJN50048.1 histidinol dehydrogenase [Pseudomonadales bacterium]|tara:strand:+ start:1629 stop:2945 length:1317 start_codon:yes stop_codon:yes gene_type:complete
MQQVTNYLDSEDAGFRADFQRLLGRKSKQEREVVAVVVDILAQIRDKGDDALVALTNRLDGTVVTSMPELTIGSERLKEARGKIDAEVLAALEQAARRIYSFHSRQKEESWSYTDEDGTELGQLVNPLQRVGIYIPGGKASYPSSVLMSAVPAQVAGVEEIIAVVPSPAGEISEVVLAAASISGVRQLFTIGGAQAIAALSYGTETVPKVDKIVGPGNIYVATAKRLVFGEVGIDIIAGPSEVVVVADGSANPDWVVMDLFAQAEHDEDAQAILISPDGELLSSVTQRMEVRLEEMERSNIIAQSLQRRGAIVKVTDLQEAIALANEIAPEHLELSVADPDSLLPQVRHAGAVFVGSYSAESIGDYVAGPSHVLPTSGTARFSSPLGVYDFQKRSSLIKCSPKGAAKLGGIAATLARQEGLIAHALSAEYRAAGQNED